MKNWFEFIPEAIVATMLVTLSPAPHIGLCLIVLLGIVAWKRKQIASVPTIEVSTSSISRSEFEQLKEQVLNFHNMLGLKMSNERLKKTT